MKIGILKEIAPYEKRVALVPSIVKHLVQDNHAVYVQSGAGQTSFADDEAFRQSGTEVLPSAAAVCDRAEVLLKVQPPRTPDELALLKAGGHYIGFLSPFTDVDTIRAMARMNMTVFSMEMVPRITRAQSMDALSAMATVAGYKAVLLAADQIAKFMPLLMTAAGTITPANVLVLGAGVAGLQAIATAKRLGAAVEAFDPRPVVKEQVESLGARFVEMPMPEDTETEGGYAKQQSDAFLKQEQDVIAQRLPKVDIVITTAQIFGKPAPELITAEMVRLMRAGAVIVDLATEQGGNCALTELNRTVTAHDVTIIGAGNLPSLVPVHASQMYAKNISNLFTHLYQTGGFDFKDEITQSTCLVHDGQIKNALVDEALKTKGNA